MDVGGRLIERDRPRIGDPELGFDGAHQAKPDCHARCKHDRHAVAADVHPNSSRNGARPVCVRQRHRRGRRHRDSKSDRSWWRSGPAPGGEIAQCAGEAVAELLGTAGGFPGGGYGQTGEPAAFAGESCATLSPTRPDSSQPSPSHQRNRPNTSSDGAPPGTRTRTCGSTVRATEPVRWPCCFRFVRRRRSEPSAVEPWSYLL